MPPVLGAFIKWLMKAMIVDCRGWLTQRPPPLPGSLFFNLGSLCGQAQTWMARHIT